MEWNGREEKGKEDLVLLILATASAPNFVLQNVMFC